jgi:tetratricopeptide (TPR) repeat protein
MATALWGLGYVALWRNERPAALAAFERMLTLCEALGDRYRVARSVNALGEVARAADDLETAEAHYRRALAIDIAIASSKAWVDRMNLALVLIARGELREARRTVKEVLEALGESAESSRLAVVHAQMLPTFTDPADFDTWDDHFAQAAELIRATALCDGDVAWVLEESGDRMIEAGDPVRARHAYELSREQWRGLARGDRVGGVEEKIAKIAASRQSK